MGALELRTRLEKFDIPLKDWTFSARERSGNFSDVTNPEGLNIIDYLELHDEFYKVGAFIKEIFDKLTTGIALIALQKNPKADFGLGGARGLEKARLYLNLEPGKARIIKAKNWAGEVNPNGLILDFKLVQGCRFVFDGWKRG